MPSYRVRVGCSLPKDSTLVPGGTVVELPAHVAADPTVACFLDPGVVEETPPDPPAVIAEPAPAADEE